MIKIKFSYTTCGACPAHALCTRSKRRTLSIRRYEAYVALEAARHREQTEDFARLYAKRAGIEGTHAKSGYVGWDCVGRVLLGNHARTFNMWQLPLPSICPDYTTG